ncbi:TraR/DksA C4-type zinc finger protein [Cognatishimia sp. F0-27]|uniref:TraR/DksA family transcriptional regulator n=1 Tax=Cognatishimia sp. F0-27 TaxID=2816855 RepID=UPI001D0C8011|nr:TraR/DksA C4-type zinc finger protein [Cognatishimia sp. F0-27]MCC1494478.1 TraR/DksA family transcriptional regulator [Cognatishimia sp. F0-27]
MTDWTAQERSLRARRAELIGDIRKIEDQLDDEPPKDWEDRASERQGDEVLESLGLHDQSELRQIDAALDRLAQGAYGICVQCGSDISAERLEALPATPFCKGCAA